MKSTHFKARLCAAALSLICCAGAPALAAPEEIVVFTDEFEKPGEIGYELHLNWANRSRTTPDHPGEQAPNRILRFMPEVVWGLSPTWNFALHVPMSRDTVLDKTTVDGLKLRLQNLHVRQLGDGASWFYGANYEFSLYHKRLSETPGSIELRGILGWRNEDWMVAVNPILNKGINAPAGVSNSVDFDLFSKVMRTVGKDVAVGLEHYSQLGPLKQLQFGSQSSQITYAVAEFPLPGGFDLHIGVGHGWTSPADKRVFKALIGLPL